MGFFLSSTEGFFYLRRKVFFIFDGRFFLGLCNYISGGGCVLIRQFERDETFDLI